MNWIDKGFRLQYLFDSQSLFTANRYIGLEMLLHAVHRLTRLGLLSILLAVCSQIVVHAQEPELTDGGASGHIHVQANSR